MTNTPLEQPNMPTSLVVNSDDPSVIARRIDGISDVIQVLGMFQRFPSSPMEPNEQLAASFQPVQTAATLINDREIAVSLSFRFLVIKSAAAISDTTQHPALQAGGSPPPGLRAIVEATYVIQYRLAPGPAPSAGALAKFGEVNSPLNVVPYWREFLDSSLRRAGLPPVMAPVHKMEPLSPVPE